MFKSKLLVLLFLGVSAISLSASIVIYQQGIALVSDEINSTSRIFKIPVSDEILPDSFIITPADKIFKMEYHEGEKINLTKYYEGYLGSKIRFVLEDGTIKDFVVLSAEPLILRDLNTKEVYFNPDGYPIFPNELYMDSKNYFIVEMTQPIDSLNFSYLTGGISWKARYFLTLKSKNRLSILGYFNIVNQLDTGFFSYNVYLLAGEIYQPQVVREKNRFLKTATFAEASIDSYEQPVGQETGYRVYRVDISDIPKKGNISIPIVQRELNYLKKFISRNPGKDYQPVDMEIFIENLPVDLPAGEVKIYDLVNNTKVFSGASNIRQTSKGDNLEIVYGKTSDILCRKVVKSTTKVSKSLYRDLRGISIKKLTDEDVFVEVYDYFPNIVTISVDDTNVKYMLQSKSEVKFTVEVPAKKEFSFQYTTEYGY